MRDAPTSTAGHRDITLAENCTVRCVEAGDNPEFRNQESSYGSVEVGNLVFARNATRAETIYKEFAQRKGYGLHDLGIKTEDTEQSVKEMQDKGVNVIQSGNRPGVKWAYLSTE